MKLLAVGSESELSRTELRLLGKPVCQVAFRKLVGLGSTRMQTLQAAQRRGQPCPLDGRYVQRTRLNLVSQKVKRKREAVVNFLEKLVQTISEPMPETQGKLQDESIPKEMRFRRPRGKRPLPTVSRKQCKMKDVSSMRLLPPGTFSDYLRLMNSELPAADQVTMKTFCSESRPSWSTFR